MSKTCSYEQIASNWDLWCEYVDTNAETDIDEFQRLTTDEKVAIQVDCFGPDEYQSDTEAIANA